MSDIKSLTKNGSLYLPENISNNGSQFDYLYYVIFYLSLILFFGLCIFGIYCLIDGRRRPDRLAAVKQITHNLRLEIIWTIIPTFIVMIIFIWGFKEYISSRVAPSNAIEIYVSGKKWFWEFTYPNGKKTVDELVVPLGKPVKLIMSSTDVLHSFYVPNLRTKKDVIPNRYSTLWFTIDQIGKFHIFCTEYCGDGHSKMIAVVEATSLDDYYAFLRKKDFDESMPLNEIGQQLYSKKGCNACHSIDGSDMVGPTWKGLCGKKREFTNHDPVIADEAYLKSPYYIQIKIVVGYPAAMPSYQGLLEEIEINAIIEYIRELSQWVII